MLKYATLTGDHSFLILLAPITTHMGPFRFWGRGGGDKILCLNLLSLLRKILPEFLQILLEVGGCPKTGGTEPPSPFSCPCTGIFYTKNFSYHNDLQKKSKMKISLKSHILKCTLVGKKIMFPLNCQLQSWITKTKYFQFKDTLNNQIIQESSIHAFIVGLYYWQSKMRTSLLPIFENMHIHLSEPSSNWQIRIWYQNTAVKLDCKSYNMPLFAGIRISMIHIHICYIN